MSASIDTGLGLPSFKDLGKMALSWAKMAIWADEPIMQIAVNAVIIVALMLSASVGFVPGIPIALAALFFATIGAVRLVVGAVV